MERHEIREAMGACLAARVMALTQELGWDKVQALSPRCAGGRARLGRRWWIDPGHAASCTL